MVGYLDGFTSVSISNMALTNIGARSTIASLAENSAEAQACNTWYEFSRAMTLQAFNWQFARKRAFLTDISTDFPAPEGQWAFRYSYPSDCVAIRYIESPFGPHGDAVPFEIEEYVDVDGNDQKSVLTNLDSAKAVYTKDQQDVKLFSPLFVQCLSFALAFGICFTLTGDMNLRDKMGQYYNTMIMTAPAHDANESVEHKPRDADTIRARQ